MLAPPAKEDLDSFPALVKHTFTIKEPKTDVVFSGLGWVTVQGANQKNCRPRP
ncbi:hypothetical protein AAG663_08815 [Bacillus licheniformis]